MDMCTDFEEREREERGEREREREREGELYVEDESAAPHAM